MKEILDVALNYGIGVVCIVYFMYFNSTTLKKLTETITKVNESLVLMKERIEKIEDNLYQKKGD